MLIKLGLTVILITNLVHGNLEGPFLFFGPKSLNHFKKPALKFLEQDELIKIYADQPAIVVFNNQDPLPLSSGCFPRLRQHLEDQSLLTLPQAFLDVHPDYINNNTHIILLQGPFSDRDAQITETFQRMQDVYGKGKVLGVLGNSMSPRSALDYEDDSWSRVRRAIDPETSTETSDDDEKPVKSGRKFALYNATGPQGQGVLLYSASWPEIKWADNTVTVLDMPIGEPTVKPTKLYTIMVVKFADAGNTKNKIHLEFSFKQSQGWWIAVGVEIKRAQKSPEVLSAPAPPDSPSAVLGKAYHCSLPLIYRNDEVTLKLEHVRMQPYMDSTLEFDDAFDCIGFTTVPIWSGLMVSFIMLIGLAISIMMIMDIKAMDKFENSRGKQLTITVSE